MAVSTGRGSTPGMAGTDALLYKLSSRLDDSVPVQLNQYATLPPVQSGVYSDSVGFNMLRSGTATECSNADAMRLEGTNALNYSMAPETERKLQEVFAMCDKSGDGQINKRELILACRKHQDIADFFKLPQEIRQEDGSRTSFESIFQAIDANDDREITWEEFTDFYISRQATTRQTGSPKLERTGSLNGTEALKELTDFSRQTAQRQGGSPKIEPTGAPHGIEPPKEDGMPLHQRVLETLWNGAEHGRLDLFLDSHPQAECTPAQHDQRTGHQAMSHGQVTSAHAESSPALHDLRAGFPGTHPSQVSPADFARRASCPSGYPVQKSSGDFTRRSSSPPAYTDHGLVRKQFEAAGLSPRSAQVAAAALDQQLPRGSSSSSRAAAARTFIGRGFSPSRSGAESVPYKLNAGRASDLDSFSEAFTEEWQDDPGWGLHSEYADLENIEPLRQRELKLREENARLQAAVANMFPRRNAAGKRESGGLRASGRVQEWEMHELWGKVKELDAESRNIRALLGATDNSGGELARLRMENSQLRWRAHNAESVMHGLSSEVAQLHIAVAQLSDQVLPRSSQQQWSPYCHAMPVAAQPPVAWSPPLQMPPAFGQNPQLNGPESLMFIAGSLERLEDMLRAAY